MTNPINVSDDSPDNSDIEEIQQPKPKPVNRPKAALVSKDTVILTYPWSETGGVTITVGDLDRLDEGEFLNDTLLEFGLKRIMARIQEERPELAESIYLFNSFFFQKLTQTPPKDP
jgi:Ulp1 family protease